jgi:ABC-type microcin C transport system permease subunit YejB
MQRVYLIMKRRLHKCYLITFCSLFIPVRFPMMIINFIIVSPTPHNPVVRIRCLVNSRERTSSIEKTDAHLQMVRTKPIISTDLSVTRQVVSLLV